MRSLRAKCGDVFRERRKSGCPEDQEFGARVPGRTMQGFCPTADRESNARMRVSTAPARAPSFTIARVRDHGRDRLIDLVGDGRCQLPQRRDA